MRAPGGIGWLLAALVLVATGDGAAAEERLSARGVVVAAESAVLSARVRAPIAAMPVRMGDRVARGDAVVTFDCALQEAERTSAVAVLRKAEIVLAQRERLHERQAAGLSEVREARADAARARADVAAIDALMTGCVLRAPFDGRVAETYAYPHEQPAPDAPLVKLVGTERLEIDLIVPSLWLRWLKPGASMRYEVDETATAHDAAVTRIGAQVDAVSQTVKITAAFSEPGVPVLPGMSGTGVFVQPGN